MKLTIIDSKEFTIQVSWHCFFNYDHLGCTYPGNNVERCPDWDKADGFPIDCLLKEAQDDKKVEIFAKLD